VVRNPEAGRRLLIPEQESWQGRPSWRRRQRAGTAA